jgi:hypothetical protein
MEQVGYTNCYANYRGAHKPKPSSRGSPSDNSKTLAPLAVIVIQDCDSRSSGRATNHRPGNQELVWVSQMLVMLLNDAMNRRSRDFFHRRAVPKCKPQARAICRSELPRQGRTVPQLDLY